MSENSLSTEKVGMALHEDDAQIHEVLHVFPLFESIVFCTGHYPLCCFVVIKLLEMFKRERERERGRRLCVHWQCRLVAEHLCGMH